MSSPIEKRTADAARSGPSIAVRTGEGSAVPALQAEPLDTATPSRSSAAQSSSPRQPGQERFVTWGARSPVPVADRRGAGRAPDLDERGLEAIAERGERCVPGRTADRAPRGHGEAGRRERVLRPGPQPALLGASEQDGPEPDARPDREGADPLRPADLVGRDRREICTGPRLRRKASHGLDGVHMEARPAGVDDRRRLGDRLDDARLVVHRLEAHEPYGRDGGRSIHGGSDRLRRDPAGRLGIDPPDVHAAAGERLGGAGHRRVLDPRDDERPGSLVERVAEREVVGLSAARGEDHVARVEARQPGDRLPRLLDEGARPTPGSVDARGVGPGHLGRGLHRRQDLGVRRRRRVPVEVDGASGRVHQMDDEGSVGGDEGGPSRPGELPSSWKGARRATVR